MHSQIGWMAANYNPFGADEVAAMKADRLKNPQPFGDKPLIVLTRGEPASGDQAEAREESRKKNQADLVTLSRQGKQIIADRSGHHIHIDQPDLVVKAIEEVISARSSTVR